jgi:NAD(P)-dependent dehydrogenase (short-subunit alcohol dehydrogenase family)
MAPPTSGTSSSTSIRGKVIVLTGAASGIGLSTAKLLASHGATLSLADNNPALLSSAVKEIIAANPNAHCFGTVVDVRSREQVDAWIATTVEKYGEIDGCGNIAGVIGKCQGSQRTWEITDEEYDFIMDVNVRGLMNCLRAQIPHVKQGGSIVNASSICGLVGLPACAVYCASKHAVIGMTRAAAKELGPKGTRVNCFNP